MPSRILSKGKFKLRTVGYDLLYGAKLKTHESLPPKKVILCYHGIDLDGNTQWNSKFTSKDHFERQISYFKKTARIVPLEEFFTIDSNTIDQPTVAITFDDGFRNNLTHALPI